MTALSALNPFVLPSVADCPGPLLAFQIRQAAMEFCRRTLIWRKTLAPVLSVLAPLTFTAPLVAAITGTLTAPFAGPTRVDYTITFSEGSVRLVTLTNGSTGVAWADPVTASTAATYTQSSYTIPATAEAGVVKLLTFSVNGFEQDVATPDQGEQIVLSRWSQDIAWTSDRLNFQVSPPPLIAGTQYGLVVALQPSQVGTLIPDDVFEGHAEDIAAGALARLMGIPEKKWSNLTLAAAKRTYFEQRIGKVALQVAKGFSRGRRRVRAHTF